MGCGAGTPGHTIHHHPPEEKVGWRPSEHGGWTPGADPIHFETIGDSDHVLIMLHGFGQTGKSIRAPFETLLAYKTGVRVILPTAPKAGSASVKCLRSSMQASEDAQAGAASMVGGTMVSMTNSIMSKDPSTNSWCEDAEFASLDELFNKCTGAIATSLDSGALHGAIEYVHQIIREQVEEGIKPEKIVVGGLGTGAFVAARAAVSFPDARLGELWMLNGFLGGVEVTVADAQKLDGFRILVTSGEADPIVPKSVTEASVEKLRELLPKAYVRFESYEEMTHFPLKEISCAHSPLAEMLLEYIDCD